MILEQFEIEFEGKLPTEEICEKIKANSEKILVAGVEITGDETMTISEVADYSLILSENIKDKTAVLLGVHVDKNLTVEQRKLKIVLSDNIKDLNEEDYTISIQ